MAGWQVSKKYPGVRWRDTKRGDTVFYITFSRAGKKVWEKVGSRDEGYSAGLAASIRADRVKEARGHQSRHRDESATFGDLAASYLTWAEAHKSSWEDDRQRYRDYLEPRFGILPARDVTTLELEKMKAELLRFRSPATVRQVLMLVSGIFTQAREWEIVSCENPVHRVKIPKIDNARERALTPEEVDKLLEELLPVSEAGHGIVLVGYHTGARLGEVCGLTWPDIDFAQKVIVFRDTKTGGTRRVPMNRVLHGYLSKRRKGAEGPAVFPDKKGAASPTLRVNAIKETIDRLFNEGITERRHRVVYHTLRHSFCTRLVAAGIPLNVVQKIVGHTTLAMMQRYAHLVPGAQQKAMEVLEG